MEKIKWHIITLLNYSICLVFIDWFFLNDAFSLVLEIVVLTIQFWIFYTASFFLFLLFNVDKTKRLYSIPILLTNITGTFLLLLFYDFITDSYTLKSSIL